MPTKVPTNLMRRTAAALFPQSPQEQEAFLTSLLASAKRGNALIWLEPRREGIVRTADRAELPGWIPEWIDLALPGEKPGKSEAYREGACYSLDFSSVLTGSALLALRGTTSRPLRVLDLCAAPGGKSILASALLHPELLLANEVERKRLGMLRHNLARCRIPRAFTHSLPPGEIARLSPECFDLCLVDAPCSGQSLLAKGIEHPGCFHPAIIKGNARRQLRILIDAAATIRAGGYLFYSTCTFSLRENEGVLERFLRDHSDFSSVPVPHLASFRSPHSVFDSYRIHPHQSPGAGGFVGLLKREGPEEDFLPPLPSELLAYPAGPTRSPVSGGDGEMQPSTEEIRD